MRLLFGQWLPDLPDFNNPGAIEAKNVIPEAQSYRSIRALSSFTNALAGRALNAIWGRAANSDIFNFAADGTSLYRLDTTVNWVDISQVGGYTATKWDINLYGERVLAATVNHTIQFYDLNVSTVFADLPNAPSAEQICIVRDFVVAGAVNGNPLIVQWSGLNNSEQWTATGATQSGAQELSSRGGPIMRVIGGDVGYIFQERSVTRMEYIGPPVIFRFDEIESARGTPAGNSVVHVGAKVYYYSTDGFYVVDTFGGTDSTPIGTDRVNQWFREEADSSEIFDMWGTVDRENSLVVWAFKSTSTIEHRDRLLMYNWQSDRWSYSVIDAEIISEFATAGLTLDQLDAVLPGGIDANPINVEDPAFLGGAINLLAFNTAHEACTFSGPVLEFSVDTTESAVDDRIVFINGARPLVEVVSGAEILLAPITRNRLQDNAIVGTPTLPNDIGICETRVSTRYLRYRLTGSADIRHASGVEFESTVRGRR